MFPPVTPVITPGRRPAAPKPKEKIKLSLEPELMLSKNFRDDGSGKIKLYSYVDTDLYMTLFRVGFVHNGHLYFLTGRGPNESKDMGPIGSFVLLKEHPLPRPYGISSGIEELFPVQDKILGLETL